MESEKRHQLDPVFKQMVTRLFAMESVRLETEVEVSRLPRTIDVLVVGETEAAVMQLQKRAPFHHFKTHNQIEFKGESDRLTEQGFAFIAGRTHLYIGENRLPLTEMSVTIICARKPIKVLNRCIAPHIFDEVSAGVYRNQGNPAVTITVVNELPITEETAPYILFAGNKAQFAKALGNLLDGERFEFLTFALAVRPELTKEYVDMKTKYQRNLEIIARDMGADLLPHISPEQMVQFMSIEDIDRLRELATDKAIWQPLQTVPTAQKRIKLVEDMSDDDHLLVLSEKNREKLIEGLDEAEQDTLLAWVAEQKN